MKYIKRRGLLDGPESYMSECKLSVSWRCKLSLVVHQCLQWEWLTADDVIDWTSIISVSKGRLECCEACCHYWLGNCGHTRITPMSLKCRLECCEACCHYWLGNYGHTRITPMSLKCRLECCEACCHYWLGNYAHTSITPMSLTA